jgi:CheY-like chemotaxis protein
MRILVADDEVSILEIIELVLTTDGHDVTRAKDGVDCMQKYNEEKAKKEGAKYKGDSKARSGSKSVIGYGLLKRDTPKFGRIIRENTSDSQTI